MGFRTHSTWRWSLWIVLLYSFLWLLLVRPDMLDQIDGYRIYGVVANVLFGMGWILFGASLIVRGRTGRERRASPS